MRVPSDVEQLLVEFESKASPDRAARVRSSFVTLFERALTQLDDGTIFVSTGDIPAMWLRDSTWQMRPLLAAAGRTGEVERVIAAVSRRQAEYVLIDPYAYAFNIEPNGNCWHKDFADQSPWVFERKYELDSLAAFIDLAVRLFEKTGFAEHLDETFWRAASLAVATIETEVDHEPESYRFVRPKSPAHDTLSHGGLGAPFARTGMSWSGFRPSDDACVYPFLVPANAHASLALAGLARVAAEFGHQELAAQSSALAQSIAQAIAQAGLAYEADGLGNTMVTDDPNIPSLLSLPYLGFCTVDDPSYLARRDWILSDANPMFISGSHGSGLSSSHTPANNFWPLATAMQGLTARSQAEAEACLIQIETTDAGTRRVHESVNIDDPSDFTRAWFSWADMTYSHLALKVAGMSALAD